MLHGMVIINILMQALCAYTAASMARINLFIRVHIFYPIGVLKAINSVMTDWNIELFDARLHSHSPNQRRQTPSMHTVYHATCGFHTFNTYSYTNTPTQLSSASHSPDASQMHTHTDSTNTRLSRLRIDGTKAPNTSSSCPCDACPGPSYASAAAPSTASTAPCPTPPGPCPACTRRRVS